MKKILSIMLVAGMAMTAMAIPAKRGWQTKVQADGSTIEVQMIGDEFYHYTINRDGKEVREVNGMYEIVGEAPSVAKVQARRAQGDDHARPEEAGEEGRLHPLLRHEERQARRARPQSQV